MTKGTRKIVLVSAGVLTLAYLAHSGPRYFNQTYLGGLLLFECLAAAVWMYRRAFFPVVVTSFLLAGVELPLGSVWTVVRWVVLGVGALAGSAIMLRDRKYHIGWFHVLATFAVLAALVSAAVSRYPTLSFLKVLSLLALFTYAGTGARVAVAGREDRFFTGLLIGCEVFVGAVGAAYLAGIEVMGNPNSLGAVMGVVGAPILLWGILVSEETFPRRRRTALFAVAACLTFASHSRASMATAFICCGLLCVALRKYRMLINGIVVISIVAAAAAILQPEKFSETVAALTDTVIFKGKDPSEGLLQSRLSPWQAAVDSINNHFWFGTGFGTSDNGQIATESLGNFSTVVAASSEYGCSYLAIISWVGMVGVLPFLMLLFVLLRRIFQTVVWMRRTGNPYHPAVPLAIVMLAGMIHAGLEDWLFAPGYYLCVFYWSMAFVFVDYVPSLAIVRARPAVRAVRPYLAGVAPSR
jgi:O-antigen ligase